MPLDLHPIGIFVLWDLRLERKHRKKMDAISNDES